MLRAEEARALCADKDTKKTEEAKKKAEEMLSLLSDAITKVAADGKHSFSFPWSGIKLGSEETRNFVKKAICEAGYEMNIGKGSCFITW